MSKKVKLAIFDGDLKARTYKKFNVSDDGKSIKVKSGGKDHFQPKFDNDSFIEFPKRSLFPPFRIKWDRVYFVAKGAKKCVNFGTEEVKGPDPELVKQAASTEMLKNLGKEKQETPIWIYIILAVTIITMLKVFGVIA